MTVTIPDTEPTELRAGDTWKWTRSFADYPATTWTLTYTLTQATTRKQIVASASGSDFSVTVAAATSAAYAEGEWSWVAAVASGSERYTLDSGTLTVLPDLAAASGGYDGRSHAVKTLAAIKAWIESKGANAGVGEYEIAGRKMKYIPITDLLKLRQAYEAEVRGEQNAERIRNGLGIGGRIQFRT